MSRRNHSRANFRSLAFSATTLRPMAWESAARRRAPPPARAFLETRGHPDADGTGRASGDVRVAVGIQVVLPIEEIFHVDLQAERIRERVEHGGIHACV